MVLVMQGRARRRPVLLGVVWLALGSLLAVTSCSAEPTATPAEDRTRGTTEVVGGAPFKATGFYRVEQANGRWTLITPGGASFYSIGVTDVLPTGDTDPAGQCAYCEAINRKYPDRSAWVDATITRMGQWGFNTAGAWSEFDLLKDKVAYTPILAMNGGWVNGEVRDWFSPDYQAHVTKIAAEQVAPRANDPNLLGWFLDNEMSWGPDWRDKRHLIDRFLALPEGSPGRAAAERHSGDPRGFLLEAANTYFEVSTRALREADPNHLILGVRASTMSTPPEIVESAGHWIDVFSVNSYTFEPGILESLHQAWAPVTPFEPDLGSYHRLSSLPILVSEFGFRAQDAGLPNTWPPFNISVATQADRGQHYRDFVESLHRAPWVIGHHWYKWMDEPPGGRGFDPENSNWGLVNLQDEPYTAMLDTVASANANAPQPENR